jgi:hypothetical protein
MVLNTNGPNQLMRVNTAVLDWCNAMVLIDSLR